MSKDTVDVISFSQFCLCNVNTKVLTVIEKSTNFFK